MSLMLSVPTYEDLMQQMAELHQEAAARSRTRLGLRSRFAETPASASASSVFGAAAVDGDNDMGDDDDYAADADADAQLGNKRNDTDAERASRRSPSTDRCQKGGSHLSSAGFATKKNKTMPWPSLAKQQSGWPLAGSPQMAGAIQYWTSELTLDITFDNEKQPTPRAQRKYCCPK